MSKTFEGLIVWQKAHQYVLSIYHITKGFPKEEVFGLTNQIRRAAVSITANIAEGYIRLGHKKKLRFYNISQGSLEETKNFIILSKDLGYISLSEKEELYERASEIGKMLNSYSQSLIQQINKPSS
ncbi:four helix bundle protein [Bacteroides sp. 51]|uniref:four helix bundle protein n=1 Tax=Bacteroides sp. 51 TaxID=2302938 RepID=UPI0013D865B5|nr:four helix bundle protein [Bacteroides sp. 51]NDV81111.1 four helix bundle protein [Bacteroides sp. 51]